MMICFKFDSNKYNQNFVHTINNVLDASHIPMVGDFFVANSFNKTTKKNSQTSL